MVGFQGNSAYPIVIVLAYVEVFVWFIDLLWFSSIFWPIFPAFLNNVMNLLVVSYIVKVIKYVASGMNSILFDEILVRH